MTATLRVMNLTKCYGSLLAVDNISFSVTEGEILALLGPNGAGKSTTMKMITGFVAPTAGTAYIDGYDILEQPLAAKSVLGYLAEGAPHYPDMTVKQFISFIADIRGITKQVRDERIASVIRQVDLGTVLEQRMESLSKGFKRRVGLAQAILHEPRVLILDEPTEGLDPNQKREVRKLIKDLAHNKVIVISTHMLEEVEALCDRVIVLSAGKIIVDSTPQELLQQTSEHDAISALENVFAGIERE